MVGVCAGPPGDDRVGRAGRRGVAVDEAAGRGARQVRAEAVVVAALAVGRQRGRADGRARRGVELLQVHARGSGRVRVPGDPEMAGAVERHARRVAAAAAELGLQVLVGRPRRVGHGRIEDLDSLRGVARDERRRAREHAGRRPGARPRHGEGRRPAAVGVAERRRHGVQRVTRGGRVDAVEDQLQASTGRREERVGVVDLRPPRQHLELDGADHVLRGRGREADGVQVARGRARLPASRRRPRSCRSARATGRDIRVVVGRDLRPGRVGAGDRHTQRHCRHHAARAAMRIRRVMCLPPGLLDLPPTSNPRQILRTCVELPRGRR